MFENMHQWRECLKVAILFLSLLFYVLIAHLIIQEEEARKRQALEAIMAENNRKIEEAQKKLVILALFSCTCCFTVLWC